MSSPSQQHQPEAHFRLGSSSRERIVIGEVPLDRCSFTEVISDIINHASAGGAPAYVVPSNAQHVVLIGRGKEPRLRDVYREANLVVADGASLLMAARVLGNRFPERIAGVDLFQALCGSAARSGLRVFLFGGRPGSADQVATIMSKRFPGLKVETYCPPYGFETNETELARSRDAIMQYRPDLLFVALGVPKQEYWMSEHVRSLGVPVCVAVGGCFEMVAGIVPRAPLWIQRIGCEWLYRLWREPRRLWRRYLIGNIQFAWIVMQQALGRRLRPVATSASSAGEGQ
jgi:N-acetylglucosaminyldiphosphoundecaprenol N-acetyl-beta-D-mannosaminyltransferase